MFMRKRNAATAISLYGISAASEASASASASASAVPSAIFTSGLQVHQAVLPQVQLREQRVSQRTLWELRGGGDGNSPAAAKKKHGRKGKSGKAAKAAVDDAIKEGDAASALGDAIRSHADALRRDRLPYPEYALDAGLVSLGLSMGTAGADGDTFEDDGEGAGDVEEVETLAYYQYGHRSSSRPNFHGSGNGIGADGQRVKPSTSAVISDYLLQTHGGTHAVQCLLSALASILGSACLILPSFPAYGAAAAAGGGNVASGAPRAKSLSRRILLSATKYQMMQQALLLATAKHASGLFGAAVLGASGVPRLGLRGVRRHLESVALDPVGQYLFYCSVLVVWMGWFGGGGGGGGMGKYVSRVRASVVSILNDSAVASGTPDAADPQDAATSQLLHALSQNPPPWFLSLPYGGFIIPILILGPVLLREISSVLWVFSDVLTLASTSSGGATGKFVLYTLSCCRSVLDAFMSILITSEKWRNADSFQRQRTLAGLVSRCSLAMELAVGGVLIADALQSIWTFAFGSPALAMDGTAGKGGVSGGRRVPAMSVLGKIVCARLYVNYLLVRRKKIPAIVGSVRGGAFLDRVLDVLIDPRKEMGLSKLIIEDEE